MEKKRLMQMIPDAADVLVAGCGAGADAIAIAESSKVRSVIGTESNSRLVALAQSGVGSCRDKVEFLERPVAGIFDAGREFDAVLVGDGTLFPFNREEVLASAARALRPGGFAVARDVVVASDGKAARNAQRMFLQLGFSRALTTREYESEALSVGFDGVAFEDRRPYTAHELREVAEARGWADRLGEMGDDEIDCVFVRATVVLTKRV